MAQASAFDHSASRQARYDQLDLQCPALLSDADPVANQANFVAMVRMAFGWHWVGFYRVVHGELVLGPFQGPVACTRLFKGKGVCAEAWVRNEAVVVPNVDDYPGHVVCSAESGANWSCPFGTNKDTCMRYSMLTAPRLEILISKMRTVFSAS